MRIRLERAGGFLPSANKLDRTVNSADLSPSDLEVLEKLLGEAKIDDLSNQEAPIKPRPDATHYRLTIEDDKGIHSVKASDADMPSALRPLITWLATYTDAH